MIHPHSGILCSCIKEWKGILSLDMKQCLDYINQKSKMQNSINDICYDLRKKVCVCDPKTHNLDCPSGGTWTAGGTRRKGRLFTTRPCTSSIFILWQVYLFKNKSNIKIINKWIKGVHHCSLYIFSSSVEWVGQAPVIWLHPGSTTVPPCGLSPRYTGSRRSACSPTKGSLAASSRGRICCISLYAHPQELRWPLSQRKAQWHLHPHTRKPKQFPSAWEVVSVQETSESHTQLTHTHAHTCTHTHEWKTKQVFPETSPSHSPNGRVCPAGWGPACWSNQSPACCRRGHSVGKEPLLGWCSFIHHVLVLPFEEAKLWGQKQRSKGHQSWWQVGGGEGHADQEGRQRDQEIQRVMWQNVEDTWEKWGREGDGINIGARKEIQNVTIRRKTTPYIVVTLYQRPF